MSQPPVATYLADYKVPDFLIDSVDLYFDLADEVTTVQSKIAIKRNGKHANPLLLNGENLKLISIALNGKTLGPEDYQLKPEALLIPHVPDEFILTIRNQINPKANTQLMGLYKSESLFCTQCESQGFRRITYFIDRPDVLSKFTTTIEADKMLYPVLLSNGNLVEQGETSKGRHFAKWVDPFKKPSYLFALVAGDLDCLEGHFQTQSGRDVLIRIFSDKGQIERCHFALECVYKAMRWDEEVFRREYDLDIFMIVAVNDFNMGAMENKGLNIFNAKYILADPQVATDIDFHNILSVVGHEYFHNWSGNRVTCRDWFQLSLKEGLTIFRDQEFSSDMGSRLVNRINATKLIRTIQFAEDASPMAHPVQPDSYIEINNFYTTTVYNKGAEVIRMLYTFLGAEKFLEAMDLYFETNDGKAVTIEEFVKAMEQASGLDFSQFRRWYKQAGTPSVSINAHYNPDEKTYQLEFAQSCPPTPNQPHKLPFQIPFAMGLLDQEGNAMPLVLNNTLLPGKTAVLNIQNETETYTFSNIYEQPIPSFLRGFSAPIKVAFKYSDEDLLFLVTHDKDGFSRWEAGQQVALRLIKQLINFHQEGIPLTVGMELPIAFEKILADDSLDKAFAAELLTLPSEGYIAEQMDIIDVDAIHAAYQHLREKLAKQLETQWLDTYNANQILEEYHYDLTNVAKRSLKNTALAYLMALKNPQAIQLCWKQFKNANNMTDSLSALLFLANVDCKERTDALEMFYQRWQKNTLVLDQWFAVQARSELPNTLSAVKNLLKHPAFDDKNPNRLRALVGTFLQHNRVQFHDKSGNGYQFLTDQICRLNTLNPQIAARFLEPFSRWRRYDKLRQEKMHDCLKQISQLPKLSKDIYEIVSKSL